MPLAFFSSGLSLKPAGASAAVNTSAGEMELRGHSLKNQNTASEHGGELEPKLGSQALEFSSEKQALFEPTSCCAGIFMGKGILDVTDRSGSASSIKKEVPIVTDLCISAQ